MSSLTLSPHAKVNLGLFIKGKREDGYHLLETLLYPVFELQDQLILSANDSDSSALELVGIELEGDMEDNLCLKAWRALKKLVPDLPAVHIQLLKKIPAGAGLGGGSSDAAFTLLGLNQLFNLGLSNEDLHPIAANLGADVPFFLYDEPMLAKGTGTDLEPFDLRQGFELKVFPQPIHSSTIAAYKALNYQEFDPERNLKEVLNQPIQTWRKNLSNDLEVPVFKQYPELAEFKRELYAQGAVYAAMSGSGSAMLGLYPHE